MKKLAILCVIPALVCASSLKDLLETALEKNDVVISNKLLQSSKEKSLESAKNSYFPTIDVGSVYQSLNTKSPNTPGDIYSGFVKIGVDLYDGGYKSSLVEKSRADLESSKFETSAYNKSLEMSIIEDFYSIKNVQSVLKALKEKNVQLEAELKRIEQFFSVGSATKDEIDKLKAELSSNIYVIETTKYQLESLKKILSIKVGKEIKTVDDSTIEVPVFFGVDLSDEIKALQASVNSYKYTAKSIDANYNPKFRLENTYSAYDYGRSDLTHPEGLDHQNKLMLTFSMRLYDNSSIKNQKESVLLQKRALESKINQAKDLQNTNIKLAVLKIDTKKAQIKSAKNTLESASSAYDTILQKYKVGVVDNIAYLDALSAKTNAMAQYEQAQNDLQVAYAAYYYYANKNIKEYIK